MQIDYTTVSGYFLKDDPLLDSQTLKFITTTFSKDRDTNLTSPWPDIWQKLQQLNQESETAAYKLLILGRHGEGVHNVAERRYGTDAWDAKWAKLDGGDQDDWMDAELTTTGRDQARLANSHWAAQIDRGIPCPQSYYSSPLRRCLETAELTFKDLPLPADRPLKITIKEMLRETMGVHTCDKRSTKSRISELFQDAFQRGEFIFEKGFGETDVLYQDHHRESNEETDVRIRMLLDDIFTTDESECISLTSHSGAIASILRVVKHRELFVQTGAVIPVLIKAERM